MAEQTQPDVRGSNGERDLLVNTKRCGLLAGAVLLALGAPLVGTAGAEDEVCGPPGDEVPATIVGSGNIVGTQGDDVIVGSAGPDTIKGLGGNDLICANGGNDVVIAGPGNDGVIGDGFDAPPFVPSNGNNDDHLIGGPGDDFLGGLGGDDILDGGPGHDELIGFGGDDRIKGGPDGDGVLAGPGDDDVSGGGGDDDLWGNYGSDHIRGGPGDDSINGDNPVPSGPIPPAFIGTNDDQCRGDSGTDTVVNCESVK